MPMTDNDLSTLDATAQAALVRDGKASPLELVDAAIERIEKVNPEINAVIHERFEAARSRGGRHAARRSVPGRAVPAEGPGHAMAGDPHHMGSRFLKEAGFRAAEDTALAAPVPGRRAGGGGPDEHAGARQHGLADGYELVFGEEYQFKKQVTT